MVPVFVPALDQSNKSFRSKLNILEKLLPPLFYATAGRTDIVEMTP